MIDYNSKEGVKNTVDRVIFEHKEKF